MVLTQKQACIPTKYRNPNVSTHNCSYLIFDKDAEKHTGVKTAPSTNNSEKMIPTCRRVKLDPYLSH